MQGIPLSIAQVHYSFSRRKIFNNKIYLKHFYYSMNQQEKQIMCETNMQEKQCFYD